MFTIDDVQMICAPDVFNEGMQLRMSDMNRRLQYFESSGTVSLHGDIFDTHDGQVYHARATVNDRTGFLLNCECGCALFRKTEEPCRHIAAALIMYADARESGRIRIGRGGPRPSDPSVLSLIEQVPPEENRPDTSHTVRIRPIVSLDPRNHAMHAEFRIGREGHKEYVLKSVHALMSALEEKDTIIYGKDLSFIPCDDSFTEDSLPLLHWLYDLDMVSSSYKDDPYWWSYSYRNQDNTHISRDLILKGRYLDEFIDLLDHCLMDCTLQGGRRAQEAGIWFVQEGDSPVMSSIRKDDKGYSFALSMPERLEGARWLYFILPETKTLLRRARKTEMNALLKYADQHNGDQVYIAERDIAAFTRKLYPALQKHTVPELSGYDPAVWLPMRPVFEIRLDLPQEDTINAELYAVYGQKKYNLLDPLEQKDPHRNTAEEKAYDTDVSSWFNSFDPENHRLVLINDPDRMYRLLKEGIPHFQTLGNVYVSDRLKKIQVRSAPTLHLGVSVSGDILQLDLFTDTMRPEELAEILSRYDMKKKYHRLKNGDFVDLDQDAFRDLARLNEDMAFSTNDLRTGRIRLPKYRAALLDADLKDSSVSYTREQSYRDLLHAFETMQTDPVPVPERWSGILREYQKKGYQWLCTLADNGFGALLADEMGLGKTVQVIAWIAEHRQNGQTLIICPASLVYNWASEFQRFAPELSVCMINGSAAARQALLRETDADVLITSYDLIKRDIDLYADRHFAAEIIDEAQYIKNAGTHAAHSVKTINADFRIALTGTPIENRLSELWSIFDYLMPGFLYSYRRFRNLYENPIVKDKDTAAQKKLQTMISPFILRRLKKEVLDDLPDKNEEVYYAALADEQKELYTARMLSLKTLLGKQSDEEFKQSKIAVLAELTRLRQLCCSPSLIYEGYRGNSAKEDLCMEVIQNAVDSGHKVLLFSQFTTMLDRLCERLRDRKISYHLLVGSTPQSERAQMVEAFAEDNVPVFCISLKAGGTGLNLTAADIVIHYDPWWNTAVENQASDRAHRIGQKNTVTVYRLIVKDTVEERILALQKDKSDMAEQILSTDEIRTSSLTREQLLAVLQ